MHTLRLAESDKTRLAPQLARPSMQVADLSSVWRALKVDISWNGSMAGSTLTWRVWEGVCEWICKAYKPTELWCRSFEELRKFE